MSPLAHPKGKTPSRSAISERGFFAPCGLPKPLPLGEVAPKVTERASPARKSRRRSDGQVLCQSDTIAVSELFGSGLALSVGLAPASSPKGRAFDGEPSVNLWKMHE